MTEIYMSTDVEADGPIPGRNSMLSFATAAFYNGKLVDTFEANLELLPEATPDPDTMKWWETQQEAWDAHRKNLEKPLHAMPRYIEWVEATSARYQAKPVFAAWPAGFDWTYVYWYLIAFVGKSPFSFSAIDIKSYAMGFMGRPYRQIGKRDLEEYRSLGRPHTHVALDDALEQGEMFINMMAARSKIVL